MATKGTLVRRLRQQLGDRPDRSRIETTALTAVAGPSDMLVPAGHTAKFRPGTPIEWDDDTGERGQVNSVTTDTNIVSVLRARDGTAAAAHAVGTDVLIDPRISFPQASEILDEIIDAELWPWVWVFAESTLPYQATNTYYSPTPADIQEVTSAYQLVSGYDEPVSFRWLGPELVDATNFPRGAIVIPETQDSSTIYFAYRAIPTLATLTTRLERIALVGASAEYLQLEEGEHVGGSPSVIERQVGDGASLRAGIARWDRFLQLRQLEQIRLLDEEQQKTSPIRSLG